MWIFINNTDKRALVSHNSILIDNSFTIAFSLWSIICVLIVSKLVCPIKKKALALQNFTDIVQGNVVESSSTMASRTQGFIFRCKVLLYTRFRSPSRKGDLRRMLPWCLNTGTWGSSASASYRRLYANFGWRTILLKKKKTVLRQSSNLRLPSEGCELYPLILSWHTF